MSNLRGQVVWCPFLFVENLSMDSTCPCVLYFGPDLTCEDLGPHLSPWLRDN